LSPDYVFVREEDAEVKPVEDEAAAAPLRRWGMRASLPKLKRSSKTFMGRFRKISAPNKNVEPKNNKKSLKQVCQTGGPRAACGPFACFVRPE
jgi:hypothetical protein